MPPKRQTVVDNRMQDVWSSNLEDEIDRIRDTVEEYNHLAMDTLLPGMVARPTGPFQAYADYNYRTLKSNVDLTKALQMSFTVCNEDGVRPEGISQWRFNFKFDAQRDLLGQDNLIDAAGNPLDLNRHSRDGIDSSCFGEHLMNSGLVLNDEVKWMVYCGSCKLSDKAPEDKGRNGGDPASITFCGWYNYAYLLQFLTSQTLPDEVLGFRESLDLFFPGRCDVADFVHHLGPGPSLCSRDPYDALRRPLFCIGQHVIEAFFRLPQEIQETAFEPRESPLIETSSKQNHKRRHRDHGSRKNGSSSGVAKTGGG